jgi:hypothetical protein
MLRVFFFDGCRKWLLSGGLGWVACEVRKAVWIG